MKMCTVCSRKKKNAWNNGKNIWKKRIQTFYFFLLSQINNKPILQHCPGSPRQISCIWLSLTIYMLTNSKLLSPSLTTIHIISKSIYWHILTILWYTYQTCSKDSSGLISKPNIQCIFSIAVNRQHVSQDKKNLNIIVPSNNPSIGWSC